MGKRRYAALAASVALAAAVSTIPADAQSGTPEKFQGNATATALELNLFGNPLTLGFTNVTGDSSDGAGAEGAGQLLDAEQGGTAEATSTGAKEDPDKACSPLEVPDEVPGVNAAVACADVLAEAPGGLPHAVANATVADITLSANELLETIQLKDPVSGAVTQVFEGLQPLFEQLEGTPAEDVPETLKGLLDGILNTDTLSIELGASNSEITSAASKVSSAASAAGAVVKVLPTGAVGGEPVLTIDVSAASANASRDRAANKNEASFDPALVRITVNETVATALQLPENTLEVAPGQSQCLLEGTPLESCVKVAAGSTAKAADGSVSAVADGVELHLLKGIPEPGEGAGVLLRLAHAEAGVGGEIATVVQSSPPPTAPPPAPAPPETPRELPRTGGPGPIVPLAGAGLLGLAVIMRRFAGRSS